MSNNQRNKTTFLQKAILIIFGLFLFLAILEIGLRLGGFVLLSLQEYRNAQTIRQKGAYHIMCLGESTTALGGKDSYPNQLAEILNQRNIGIRFSVINKGVPGTNSAIIATLLEEILNKYKPDMVITMIGINDFDAPSWVTDVSKRKLFFESFKTYKLTKLLWLHIGTKFTILSSRCNYPKEIKLVAQEEAFKKAIEYDPIELAQSYFLQGKSAQAEAVLKRSIEVNSNDAQAYTDLAFFYLLQEKPAQAEAVLKRSIEVNAKNCDSYTDLAFFYLLQEKPAQAEAIFKKSADLNLNNNKNEEYIKAVFSDREVVDFKFAQQHKKTDFLTPVTVNSYLKIKETLNKRKIKLVCVQYPMCNIKPLKEIFKGEEGIIFVDNEGIFKEALKKSSYWEFFLDNVGGNFGHCKRKGNRLLAENIANVILKEVFKK